jgi:hypothetical protein
VRFGAQVQSQHDGLCGAVYGGGRTMNLNEHECLRWSGAEQVPKSLFADLVAPVVVGALLCYEESLSVLPATSPR